ncbi:MAG: efflux RND transporter periplasmic adaptor subunit [Acidobacteria bacterium]|nr:efflux RND transporter periplasmic adaptor subunit [Acidobacteriota bacterium]
MKTKYFVITGVSLIILALAACSGGVEPGHVQPERQTLRDVPVMDVMAGEEPVQYVTTGTVTAHSTAAVSSKIMGAVRRILVEEGDTVRTGQLLMIIDDRDIVARVQQAESMQAEAESALEEVAQAIDVAEEGLTAATAQKELMDATYRRFENLRQKESVSQQEFDEVQARWEAANAAEAQARAMVESVRARKQQVSSRIQQAKAGVEEARSYLSYVRIVSPFAGRVVKKLTDVGSMAAPGLPLLMVEKEGQFQLEVGVDESMMRFISLDMNVTVEIPTAGFRSTACPLAEIVRAVDPMSRTVKVKVGLPAEEAIQSGQFGRLIFPAGRQEVIRIPATALLRKGALDGVYVVNDDNVLRWRIIRTGKTVQNQVQILSGLSAGERIVARNPELMMDGAKVEVNS